MLKQLYSHQNKEKHLKRLGTKLYRREIRSLVFEFDVFFFCSYIIALQLRFLLEFSENRQWV